MEAIRAAAARRSSASSPTAGPRSAWRVLRAASAPRPARAIATRPSRTSSSRSRRRATRCCAATGCSPARSSARSARTRPPARELDNAVLERAQLRLLRLARAGAARVGRPASSPSSSGVLDWLEVHELHEVVAGEVPGRAGDDDVVVFKSNGIAAWDVAAAAAVATSARASAASASSSRAASSAVCAASATSTLVADRADHLRPVEQPRALLRRRAVADVAVVEDLLQRRGRARARGSRTPRAGPPGSSGGRGTRTDCGRARRAWPRRDGLYPAGHAQDGTASGRFAERVSHGVDDGGEPRSGS